MNKEILKQLRYPIGYCKLPEEISNENITNWIAILEEFPKRLENLVKPLSEVQLDTPYRPEGWTVRQLVHHIADSHHHSYTRFKWALAENKPLIKAYEEKDWANLVDAKTAPISLSINYIMALHSKMVYMLKGLSLKQLKREYLHPEDNMAVSVEENIGKYAWHSNHHYAHIESLVKREGW